MMRLKLCSSKHKKSKRQQSEGIGIHKGKKVKTIEEKIEEKS